MITAKILIRVFVNAESFELTKFWNSKIMETRAPQDFDVLAVLDLEALVPVCIVIADVLVFVHGLLAWSANI